jgi:hypothetical protein
MDLKKMCKTITAKNRQTQKNLKPSQLVNKSGNIATLHSLLGYNS